MTLVALHYLVSSCTVAVQGLSSVTMKETYFIINNLRTLYFFAQHYVTIHDSVRHEKPSSAN